MAKRVNKRFLIILTAVVAVGAVAGMAGTFVMQRLVKKDPKVYVAESERLEKDGDVEGAIGKYQAAVGADQTDPALRVELGKLYYRHVDADPQNFGKAHQAWESALAVDPTYRPAMEALLNSHWEYMKVAPSAASFKAVREAARRIVAADPNNAEALARLNIVTVREAQAKIPTKSADVEKAVAALRGLAKQDPANADLLLWLVQGDLYLAAEALGKLADTEDVRAILAKLETTADEAIKGQETNAAMQLRVAQVRVQFNALENAIQAAAARDGTGPATAPTTRGSRAMAAGRFTDRVTAGFAAARQHAKPSDELFYDVYYASSEWFRALGKVDEMRKVVEQLEAARPDEPNVRLLYTRTFHGDRTKRDKIIEMLSRKVEYKGIVGVEALRLREMEAGMQVELANLRLAGIDGEKDQAKRKKVLDSVQEELKRLELLAGAQAVPLLEIKGRIKLLQGRMIDAIPLLQQAVDRNPEGRPNYEARLQLANAYSLNGQTGQAEKLLRQIVTRVPGFTPGRVQLIQVLWSDGQFEGAREELASLKKEHPEVKEIPALEALVEGGAKREAYVEQMPESTPVERLRKAVVLRADGKLDEAIELAAAAYKADPKFLGALEQLLGMYMQAGRRDEALAAVKEAIKHNPDNEQLASLPDRLTKRTPEEFEQWQLARIKQEKDPATRALTLYAFYAQKANAAAQVADEATRKTNAAEAERYLVEAEKLKPDDVKVMGTRFEFLLGQRRFGEVAPVLKKLAAANADEVNGELLRFRLAQAKGDLGAAEAAAREMSRTRPQFALGWQLLGQALHAQGRHRDAAAAYASALERQGRNYEAIKGLVEVQYALNDPAEAKHVLDRAREMFPNDVALREMAFSHEMTHGDPQQVIAERERLMKTNPVVPGNALALAETYLKSLPLTADPKQTEAIMAKSRALLENGMKKWPNDARFMWPLAQVLQAQGDFFSGEKLLKEYAAREDVKDKIAVDTLMADFYTRGNKPAMAEQSYRDALEKARGTDKENGVKLQLAQLLASTGRTGEAVKLLDGVAGPRAARQRVQFLAASGKRDEAERAIREAVAANPGSAELSNLQLDMHIDGGRLGDAEQVVRDRLAKDDADDTARYYGALVKLRKSPPDAAGAVKDLVALADRNPRAVNVLTLLGDAYAASGDQGSAIDAMDRAHQLQPLNRDIRVKLVDWCVQARRWDSVVKLATEAAKSPQLANDPTWPRALAGAYAATGRFTDAEKQIAQALKLAGDANPRVTADIQRDQLQILTQGKAHKRVLQLTDAWIAKGREEWWIYQFRGMAKSGLKDNTAVKEFEQALAGLNPSEQFGAAQAVVRTIAQTAGPDVALRRIEKWETENPRWRIVAAEICLSKDDAAAGVSHLLPLEADAGKLPADVRGDFYRVLGQCYHQSRPRPDVVKAAEAYKKYLELNPGDAMALNNLAYVLAEEFKPPQPKDAKIYSQKAYDLARDWRPGDGKSRVLDTHAWVLILNGGSDLDEGVRILEEIVDESPLLEARYHLGEAHLQRKRADEAQHQLNLAVAMIEKYKKDKTSYDETLEPRIQRALEAAKALNAAAGAR